jgi:hypothetical protein
MISTSSLGRMPTMTKLTNAAFDKALGFDVTSPAIAMES